MKTAIITINQDGEKIAAILKKDFGKWTKIFDKSKIKNRALKDLFGDVFFQYNKIIFIGAVGIAVRNIAPLIRNKHVDPAVVCIDSAGRYAISLLSGHEGGANELAYSAAKSLSAFPIITTASEATKKYILGIGTRRDINKNDVLKAIRNALKKANLSVDNIRIAATIDIKKYEKGLIKACKELKIPLVFISRKDIKNFKGEISPSKIVRRYLDLDGVCEPCACIAACLPARPAGGPVRQGKEASLILKKQVSNGTAVAIAKEYFLL